MKTVKFHCKDRNIENFVQQKYGKLFSELVNSEIRWAEILVTLKTLLFREAVDQEWWDYTEDFTGVRTLKKKGEHGYIALVPTFTIEEA